MAETLWPFPAAGEIVEVLEWRTDVLQARTAEQRIALRPRPRVILTLRHRLDALGLAEAAALARAGVTGAWSVPLWHRAVQPASALGQGDGAIWLDDTAAFSGAAQAVLAIDGGAAATVAIAAVQTDHLVLAGSLGAVLPSASVAPGRMAVMPVGIGRFAAAVDVTRRRRGDGTVTATFLLQDVPEVAETTVQIHLGHPVLTDPSVVRRPLASSLRQTVEYVDNGFGPVVVEPLRDLVERTETITLRAQGPAARAQLAAWLWNLRGRQAAFWLPSWGREPQLVAAMTASTTVMRATPVGAVSAWVGRSILLEMQDGPVFRTITAAVAEEAAHRLTLSGSVGSAVPADTPVHLMTLVRSDSDRTELRHGAVATEVSLPVVEVPA